MSNWIKVDDYLPFSRDEIFIFGRLKDRENKEVVMGFMRYPKEFFTLDCFELYDCTHWQLTYKPHKPEE